MTINIFLQDSYQLKCILNPNIEKFIKCLALNIGKTHELAAFYDQEIILFSASEEKIIEKFKCPEPRYLEFNNDNKLLILTKNMELLCLDLLKKKIEPIKGTGKATLAKWYPFNVRYNE